MSAWMEIGDPNPNRLRSALAFIIDGRAVDFGGFSLAVLKGILQVDVDYPVESKDEVLACELVEDTKSRVDILITQNSDFSRALSALPRRYSLIRSTGNGDAELGSIVDTQLHWR